MTGTPSRISGGSVMSKRRMQRGLSGGMYDQKE